MEFYDKKGAKKDATRNSGIHVRPQAEDEMQ
jgi:hypothetical protein